LRVKLCEPIFKAQSVRFYFFRDHGGPVRFGIAKILTHIWVFNKGGLLLLRSKTVSRETNRVKQG